MRGVNMAYLWCMETCFEKRQHWEQGREVNPKPLRKCVLVAQSCLTFCDPMNCSLPGSSVHGIFQARILEWVAISFSRGSSQPRVQTWVSCIAGRFFTIWTTREGPPYYIKVKVTQSCLIICNPMDYTFCEILQARILEWKAFPFSRGSSQFRDRTQFSWIAGRFFTSWATRGAQEYWSG